MKRQFPYYSAVPSIELQGGRRPAQDPSREYVEPRVYQAREQSEYEELEQLTVRARGGAQRAGRRQRQRAGRGGAGSLPAWQLYLLPSQKIIVLV